MCICAIQNVFCISATGLKFVGWLVQMTDKFSCIHSPWHLSLKCWKPIVHCTVFRIYKCWSPMRLSRCIMHDIHRDQAFLHYAGFFIALVADDTMLRRKKCASARTRCLFGFLLNANHFLPPQLNPSSVHRGTICGLLQNAMTSPKESSSKPQPMRSSKYCPVFFSIVGSFPLKM